MSAILVGRHFPKERNLDQNINDSKSHIWNSFFENIISGIQLFYIRPQVLVDIIRVFFNFRFSSRKSLKKSQKQQKLAKYITHFTIQFGLKNRIHFTNLNSLDIENSMLLQHNQKPLSLYNFFNKHICLVSEITFALHRFLTPKNCNLEGLSMSLA